MRKTAPTYHEKLLHWIWETRNFNTRSLHTASGDPVKIHFPGQSNKSDGPDFSGAQIEIGQLQWYGDVEIHWKLSDWHAHGHGQDPRYNNVVLHVVFRSTDQRSLRKDRTSVPTLCLAPQLSHPLEAFLEEYLKHPQLPCSKQLSYISEEAFARQIKKAHNEYFEQKIDDLLSFYDPDLPPSRAWLKILTVALFDGLGISHNRESMRKLCSHLVERITEFDSADDCKRHALSLSGLLDDSPSPTSYKWNHKGCRPNNQPRIRIQQAALAFWYIYQQPFGHWMRTPPQKSWKKLIQSIDMAPSVGPERSSILFGTVFLPSLYILGNLFHKTSLKDKAWNLWVNHEVKLPKSLLKKFHKTELRPALYNNKLGTIHQLRNYCQKGGCQKCFVFKNEIFS
ncbi:DUF2851 family protein [Fodinibius salsisoli]|uniref:DUF2851 family protein n=1 Tax=Fodinibius salsisoli TaxID=2820877 RepID=A0ABT3PRT3_9BACT|nr:DUF2851 family protein [Fodinibius salsisoli]